MARTHDPLSDGHQLNVLVAGPGRVTRFTSQVGKLWRAARVSGCPGP
ncbi:MAG TPA: hypothetical protein VGM12_28815 [Trebonia sp.]|nr:hypothetical protein [Trebonia sp.]